MLKINNIKQHQTTLMHAVSSGHKEIVLILIKEGASFVNSKGVQIVDVVSNALKNGKIDKSVEQVLLNAIAH